MKTNLTSRSSLLALLMVVLLLSSPLATLAQQIPAEVSPLATLFQQIPAEAQAKRDAKNDVNKFAWFTAGLIGCASTWAIIELFNSGYIGYPESALDISLMYLIVAVPTFSPIVYARFASSAPPPERLLGKSSEYVNAYVDSYAKEVKRQRVILSLTGMAVMLIPIGVINMDLGVSSSFR